MSEAEARLKAELDAELARVAVRDDFDKVYFQAIIESAKGSIDRAKSAAELVEKAAASIGVLYNAIVAVSFSVTDHRLPLRGFLPTGFLGLAIVLSMVYLAYLTPPKDVTDPVLTAEVAQRMANETKAFIERASSVVNRRSFALRGSIVALGVGVAFIALPFLDIGSTPKAVTQQLPEWPAAPRASTQAQAALESIVLKAKVDEVAEARKEAGAQPPKNDTGDFWRFLAIGLILVIGAPPIVKWIQGKT